jgi:PKD repeat protein
LGTIYTHADEPCNQVAEANINENWTIGDLLGLDNDGDLLYDTLDPDCAVNEAPIADPDGPYMGTVGVAVPFDGSGSSDPDGSIMAYDWDFGDGGTGTGVAPMYAYAAPGSYTVTLTVTDNDGMTDSATTTAEIQLPEPLPPTADPDGPYAGIVGESVQFDGSGSSDPDGTIVAYDWDFGDGGTATGVAPMYAYADPGTYTVTLTVTGNDGLTDTAMTTADIQVMPEPLPPIADPDGPYMGTVGAAVQFDGSGSTDPDGTIVAYDWDFGDGGTGTGVAPMYAYAAPGAYTVTLTVTDNDGLMDTATTTADIQEMPMLLPPIADPDGPYMGTVGAAVAFDGSGSADPDGTIVAYDWDFGDGTFAIDAGPTPTHTYTAAGEYQVMLMVTDNDGLTDVASTTATIEGPPMQAVDLDIVRLRVTNRVKLKQVRPISIKLVIKNRGSVDEPRLAMVVGVQNGDEVYAELLLVSDPVGHGHTTIEFPPYQPTEEGAILWTAQIADDDPDLDEATATTTVGKSARRPEHSPVGSHGRHVGTRHGHAGRKSPHHH